MEAPQLETEIWQYYNSSLGNPNQVPVTVIGYSDITGSYSGSSGVYDTGYSAMQSFIMQKGLTYPILIEDGGGQGIGVSLFGTSGYPNNVIINGIPNDPNYQQWEVIYLGAGFTQSYIDVYKGIIDGVTQTTDPILNFKTNQNIYFPGDTLSASLNVRYYGEMPTVDLYAAIMAFGQIIFYPSWTNTAEANQLIVAGGFNQDFPILNRIPISTGLPEGTYSLLSICARSGTLNPVGELEKLDFNVSHAVKGSMKTYFKDNPVYQTSSGGSVPLVIYLENTGPQNITIDTFEIDTFDAEGNFQGTQDASSDFSSWFNVPDSILTVGLTASANLQFKNPNNIERQAQFYFHGIDKNDGDVEVTSEKLIMKAFVAPGN
ncbi:hypothetical protein KKB18_01245 [bacterium]|nr:hypothetical protein [bacterium]